MDGQTCTGYGLSGSKIATDSSGSINKVGNMPTTLRYRRPAAGPVRMSVFPMVTVGTSIGFASDGYGAAEASSCQVRAETIPADGGAPADNPWTVVLGGCGCVGAATLSCVEPRRGHPGS